MRAAARAVTVALAGLSLLACSGIQVQVGVYQTLEEARAAGAIEHGWVPRGLPESTSDLREGHLPDGRLWGAFSFDPARKDALESLVATEITSGSVDCDPPGRLAWWPPILRSPIDLERLKATGFQIYRGRDSDQTLAINWRHGRAYYWR